jgi:predicted  nucleic acid-binding Zn-ribbon protein
MEQINENENASEKVADATETARQDSIEQQHDVAQAQIDSANPPAEGASHDLVKVSEERATYQTQAKARLDKVRIRLDAAQQKLTVLGSRAPTALRGELETASRQYQSLERDLMSVSQIPATNWETTTGKIDERLNSLDARVTDLSDSIEDV